LQAEQLLYAEPFRSLCVLRFAPIYDSTHLQDVAKRVFLPGTRVKLRLCPPPVHSLCSLHRAVEAIVASVETTALERYVANVTDAAPISQSELLEWFPGRALPVPSALLRSVAGGIRFCGGRGRTLSRMIQKFIASSIYPDAGTLPTVSGS